MGRWARAFSWQARTLGGWKSSVLLEATPPQKPGLAWLESVGGSLLVSHASFLGACEGACWGHGLQDAPSFSRWVLELDPQDPSLRAAGGCPLAGFLMPRWPLALGVWDVE